MKMRNEINKHKANVSIKISASKAVWYLLF